MTLESFEICLRTCVHRQPFRPFQIELTSGDRIQVTYPETVMKYGKVFAHRSAHQKIGSLNPRASHNSSSHREYLLKTPRSPASAGTGSRRGCCPCR